MFCQVGCIEFITESLLRIIYDNHRNNTTFRRDLHLPEEVIGEILSWLPVKSILRFKCVCKLWLSITSDPEFIHKHMMRTIEIIWAVDECNGYFIRSMSRGLILERTIRLTSNYWLTSNYRLRNPTTRRVFDLPYYDHKDLYPPMRSWYVSETRMFKIAFPSPKGNGSFKILSVGVDETWRTIDFPFTTSKLTKAKNLDIVIEGVYIVVVSPITDEGGNEPETQDGPDVVCLEMESEKMWKNSIPKPFFENMSILTVTNWDGKPAIAGRLGCNGLLYVLVLEDYKSQKWAQHAIVIDLSSISLWMNAHRENYVPYYFKDDELWMRHDYKTVVVDTVTKVVMHIDTPKKTRGRKFKGQPSLMEFKGMKSCDDCDHENKVIIGELMQGFSTSSRKVFATTRSTANSECAECWLRCPKRAA